MPHLVPLLPNLKDEFDVNPMSDIYQVDCSQWNHDDRIILMGDSSHDFAPFYDMGMNTCFEDCHIFSKLLSANDFDFSETIREYASVRKQDVKAIQMLTNNNYYNLQESTDKDYDAKWKLERKLWEAYPDLYMPEYFMVSFTQIPFSKIIARLDQNKQALEKIYAFYQHQQTTAKEGALQEFVHSHAVRELLYETMGESLLSDS